MSTELERAMKKLADMGVTVSTTARSGADSIAGRIQAEAERQDIAGRRLSGGAPDYWCHVCNRGAEGCNHPIPEENP